MKATTTRKTLGFILYGPTKLRNDTDDPFAVSLWYRLECMKDPGCSEGFYNHLKWMHSGRTASLNWFRVWLEFDAPPAVLYRSLGTVGGVCQMSNGQGGDFSLKIKKAMGKGSHHHITSMPSSWDWLKDHLSTEANRSGCAFGLTPCNSDGSERSGPDDLQWSTDGAIFDLQQEDVKTTPQSILYVHDASTNTGMANGTPTNAESKMSAASNASSARSNASTFTGARVVALSIEAESEDPVYDPVTENSERGSHVIKAEPSLKIEPGLEEQPLNHIHPTDSYSHKVDESRSSAAETFPDAERASSATTPKDSTRMYHGRSDGKRDRSASGDLTTKRSRPRDM